MERVALSRLQSQSLSFFASLIVALICVLPSQAGTLSVTGGSGFSNPVTVGPNPGLFAQFNAVDTNIPNGIAPTWSASVMGAPLGCTITSNGNNSAVVQVGGGSNLTPGTYNVTLTVTASYSVPYAGQQTDMGSISFTLNVVGVTMPTTPIMIAVTNSQTVNVTVIPAGASGISYVSANPSVATITNFTSSSFTVKGVAGGVTQINAMYGNTTSLGSVTVIVVSATFTPQSLSLYVGQTQGVTVNLIPSGAPVTLTFASNNPTVASVPMGGNPCNVTGNAVGTANITVAWNNTTLATLPVTVSAPSVTFTPQAVTVFVGQTVNVTPTITPSSASGQITYTSAMPSIASATGSGTILTVQGMSPGTTQVNAMVGGTTTSIGVLPVTVLSQPTVAFASASYNVNENAGMVPITVSLTGSSPNSVSVSYATMGGSAIAGIDYTSAMGTLTFAPGVTSQSFNVDIIDKGDFSNQVVSFSIQLSNPSQYLQIGSPSTTTVNITDNDQPPQITVTVTTTSTSPAVEPFNAATPETFGFQATYSPTVSTAVPEWTWSTQIISGPSGPMAGMSPPSGSATSQLTVSGFTQPGYWQVQVTATVTFYGNYSYSGSYTVSMYEVGIDHLQYQILPGGNWTDMPAQGLYVATGTAVNFQPVITPAGAPTPTSGFVVWGGTCGASGTAPTTSVTLSTPSQSMSDAQTITATYGNTVSAPIIRYGPDQGTLTVDWDPDNPGNYIATATYTLWAPDDNGVATASGGNAYFYSVDWTQNTDYSLWLTTTWPFTNGVQATQTYVLIAGVQSPPTDGQPIYSDPADLPTYMGKLQRESAKDDGYLASLARSHRSPRRFCQVPPPDPVNTLAPAVAAFLKEGKSNVIEVVQWVNKQFQQVGIVTVPQQPPQAVAGVDVPTNTPITLQMTTNAMAQLGFVSFQAPNITIQVTATPATVTDKAGNVVLLQTMAQCINWGVLTKMSFKNGWWGQATFPGGGVAAGNFGRGWVNFPSYTYAAAFWYDPKLTTYKDTRSTTATPGVGPSILNFCFPNNPVPNELETGFTTVQWPN